MITQLLNDAIYNAAFRTVDNEAAKKFDESIKKLVDIFNNKKEELDIETANLIVKLATVKKTDDYIAIVVRKAVAYLQHAKS